MKQTISTKPAIVMVCVTRQRTCARLIACGEDIAKREQLSLHVVHAVNSGENFLDNPHEGEALEYLFKEAQKCDAELSVLRADSTFDALVNYAKENNAAFIVMGAPGPAQMSSFTPTRQGETIISRFQEHLKDVQFEIVQ